MHGADEQNSTRVAPSRSGRGLAPICRHKRSVRSKTFRQIDSARDRVYCERRRSRQCGGRATTLGQLSIAKGNQPNRSIHDSCTFISRGLPSVPVWITFC